MFEELGIDLAHVKSPVSIGVGKDIIDIESVDDLEDYRQLLVKLYPASKPDIWPGPIGFATGPTVSGETGRPN